MVSPELKASEHANDVSFGPVNAPGRGRRHTGPPPHMHGASGEGRNPRPSNCSPRRGSNGERNHAECTMFHSARNVVVSHATFMSQQTVHIHKESNTQLGSDGSQEASQSPSKPDKENTSIGQQETESSTRHPVQKTDAEIYQEFIGKSKARGNALFTPQPYSQLPKAYRAKGVCIGDVGVFTPEGGFDFLFNILLSPSDPTNPAELPQDFAPLTPPLKPMDVRKFKEYSCGSHLLSPNVSPVKGKTLKNSGMAFQSFVPDGAILLMPDGASAEELSNLPIFYKYISDNAHNFYDFARNVRGRAIKNGQLHVVYGCRKTTSWGIATFTDTSDLQLEFLPAHDAGSNISFSWNYTLTRGTAQVKTGPDAEDSEDLDGVGDGVRPKNQCLFASTLSIRLGSRPRNKRQHKGSLAQTVDDCGESGSSIRPTSLDNSQISESGSGSLNGLVDLSPSNFAVKGNMCLYDVPYDTDEILSEEHDVDKYDNAVIIQQNSSFVYPTSPSEVLTEYLLRVVPNAAVALASDRDLPDCILSGDRRTLIDKVCALNSIREENNIVFFEPKEYYPPQEEIEHILQLINVGEFDVEKYLFGPLGRRSLDKLWHRNNLLLSLNQHNTWPLQSYPHRPLSLDQIMDFCSKSAEERLSLSFSPRQSVTELRRKLREEQNIAPNTAHAQNIRNLAESLFLRFTGFSQQDDLDEAIWLYEHALTATSDQTYQHTEVLHNLLTSLAARYRLSKQPHDYKRLVQCSCLQRSMDIDKILAPIRNAMPTSIPRSMPNEIGQDTAIMWRGRNRLFALLIGINTYKLPSIPQLSGAVADAQAMRQYLVDSLGYSAPDMTLLVDESATRNAIIEAFQALAIDTRIREGEPILIYYAGHGSQINVPGSISGSSQEVPEAIIPYDYNTTPGHEVQAIPDSTLELLLLDIAKSKGKNITVIMDCCRSKTLFDLDGEAYLRDCPPLTRSTCLYHDDTVTLPPIGAYGVGIPRYGMGKSHIRISACSPGETAWEGKDGRGIFTKALLTLLKSTDIRNMTYENVMEGLTGLNSNQNPRCDGVWKNHYLFRYGDPLPLQPPLKTCLFNIQSQLRDLQESLNNPNELERPRKKARLNHTTGRPTISYTPLVRYKTVNMTAPSDLVRSFRLHTSNNLHLDMQRQRKRSSRKNQTNSREYVIGYNSCIAFRA